MMGDKPAFHCGADPCCEGQKYPGCMTAVATTEPERVTHWDDEQGLDTPFLFSD